MVLCSDPRRFVVLGFVSTSCPVAASALRCARPAVHPVKSYCEYQRRLSVQRGASESVCIFLHILGSSLCAGHIGKEFKRVVHMCQKRQKYFVKYAPPEFENRLVLVGIGHGRGSHAGGKFSKGDPQPVSSAELGALPSDRDRLRCSVLACKRGFLHLRRSWLQSCSYGYFSFRRAGIGKKPMLYHAKNAAKTARFGGSGLFMVKVGG